MLGMRRVVYTLEYPSLCRLLLKIARLRALQLISQLCALLTPAIEVTCIATFLWQYMQHKPQQIPSKQQLFIPVTVALINLQLWKALNINYN